MAAKTRQKLCFNCQEPTTASVESKQKKGRTFICMADACWKAYWKLQEGSKA